MPSAVEFQQLADELRQVENAIIQAASDGDQELVLLAVGAQSSCLVGQRSSRRRSGRRGSCCYRKSAAGRVTEPHSADQDEVRSSLGR